MPSVFAIYFSLFMQMQAISLLGIAIPYQLSVKSVSPMVIGAIMSCYSIGLIIGCLKGKEFIYRVGHTRAFAGFASLSAITAMLHFLIDYVYLNALFRLMTGLSAAVLIVALESWCLTLSSKLKSKKIISGYQVVLYASMATGLLLINLVPGDINHAYIIAACLYAVAMLPMSLVKLVEPKLSSRNVRLKDITKQSPIGIVGAITAGAAIGSVYNLAPVFAKSINASTLTISLFMVAIVLSGILLQHLVEFLSRIMARERVLILCLICLAINALFVHSFARLAPLPLLGLLIGCLIACLYPLSLTITANKLQSSSTTSVSSAMLLLYGFGGISGPIIAGSAMEQWGNDALFMCVAMGAIFSVLIVIVLMFYQLPRKQILPSKC